MNTGALRNHEFFNRLVRLQADLPNHDVLNQIIGLIIEAGGVDFSCYKPATIRRRMAHRMALKKISGLDDYFSLLKENKEEVTALYEFLLVTVTEFFRDPDTFDCLERKIIPEILKHLPDDSPARVWVPACASGEEAFSIAMCFTEVGGGRPYPPARIFATDVSKECITKARSAIYPEGITPNISIDRLHRFFTKDAGGYRIAKTIRELCIFAEQDVIDDPPLPRMDLVSCRNLLIYLDTPAQKHVLEQLHYSLKPTGFLVLGTAESVATDPDLFRQVHKPLRIYSKRD